ncbi:hypothetical protein RB199_39940 [Streptomyces libani]
MPLHLSDLLARPDLGLSASYDVPPRLLARTIEAATDSRICRRRVSGCRAANSS